VPTDLVAVVAIPPYEVKTSEARRILPPTLTRAESIIALQRSALITAMFATGQIAELRGLFDDAWHEHHRTALNPGLTQARQAAAHAGAIGTVLSGSGSTVLSFAHVDHAPAVARAVKEAYTQLHIAVQMRVVPFDNAGITPIGD
jgi:homoserine kinase